MAQQPFNTQSNSMHSVPTIEGGWLIRIDCFSDGADTFQWKRPVGAGPLTFGADVPGSGEAPAGGANGGTNRETPEQPEEESGNANGGDAAPQD